MAMLHPAHSAMNWSDAKWSLVDDDAQDHAAPVNGDVPVLTANSVGGAGGVLNLDVHTAHLPRIVMAGFLGTLSGANRIYLYAINDNFWVQGEGAVDVQRVFVYLQGNYQNGCSAFALNAPSPKIDVAGYLAENIVWDATTSKYWWVFTDTNVNRVRVAWANTINGAYTVQAGFIGPDAGVYAPHLVKFGSYWYLYYTQGGLGSGVINLMTSDTVNSGYSASGIDNPMLDHGGAGEFDFSRAAEPYVFLDGSTYRMLYMGGDNTTSADEYERCGMATASSPAGPWTKRGKILPDAAAGSWNAGKDQTADPFAFLKDGVWYIGVTGCKVAKSDWQVGFYKTTDWATFTEIGPALVRGAGGSWDDDRILRGAVMEVGGVLWMSYTGHDGAAGYKMGLTTLTLDNPTKMEVTVDANFYLLMAAHNGDFTARMTGDLIVHTGPLIITRSAAGIGTLDMNGHSLSCVDAMPLLGPDGGPTQLGKIFFRNAMHKIKGLQAGDAAANGNGADLGSARFENTDIILGERDAGKKIIVTSDDARIQGGTVTKVDCAGRLWCQPQTVADGGNNSADVLFRPRPAGIGCAAAV